ncbi:MBL fold metallo-hydrolase [Lentisphaerota bacterium ZTH]|nr:MBL fold metallo-hydrolase [Lentisphaerota bacterium]WET05844.1 MBL fold metallo-hydrolase [Lentisphaerota bacterium ZTH]
MKSLYVLLGVFLSLTAVAAQPIIYVNSAAAGGGNGSSWADAFRDLQSAVKSSRSGQQIWVAKGKYFPTETTDRDISFRLQPGVKLYGGFAGNEQKLSQRNWKLNKTILSGNIGDKSKRSDNSKHVVIMADKSVLDGVIVQCGFAIARRPSPPPMRPNASGRPQNHTSPRSIMSNADNFGAGILNYKAAGIIRNTTIRNCYAMKGGGAYNMTCSNIRNLGKNASPVFINVKFENNYAMGRGGAMANDLQTNSILIGCEFTNNYCAAKGGALYNDFNCSPILINCIFSENKAYDAGAIGNDGGSCPILVRTVIRNNVAINQGAGLYLGSYNASRPEGRNAPVLIQCTVSGNRSETSGPVITTWGQDWVYAWNSKVEDWPYGIKTVPPQYAKLLKLSEKIKQLDAAEIQGRYLKSIKLFLPTRSSDLGRAKGEFRSDYPMLKTADIPDRVFYVNCKSKCKEPNGKSWGKAFKYVREAIETARSAGGGEVWVATGVYTPSVKNNRSMSFKLEPGVAVYGGFKGTETKREMRDYDRNKTILSGNIGDPKKSTDNTYHVVVGASNSILDGFIITGGHANGPVKNCYGGGLFCWGNDCSPIVRNCIFSGNYACDGGAIFAFENVRAYFKNVKVYFNKARLGGGMSFRFGSSCLVEDCEISNNTADSRGGGAVVNYGSNVEFLNTVFKDNITDGNGGAVWVDDQASQYGGTSPLFKKCTFTNNSAVFYGGAIHNYNIATSKIIDCTFAGNKARYGNDIANTLKSRVTMQDNKLSADGVYNDKSSQVYRFKKKVNSSGIFSATIIGSGSPEYNPERSGPSVLIRCGSKNILVDMGTGTQARLAKLNFKPQWLNMLMFTHHHIDHDAEFTPIFIWLAISGRPFRIVGTPPTAELAQNIMKYYKQDLEYRLSRQNRTLSDVHYSVKEVQGGESFEYDGIAISTARVNHTIHTVAYRFDYKGKSIVISGDLSYSPSLPVLAKNADLLIIDSGQVIKKGQKMRRHSRKKLRKNRAHCSLDELGEMLAAANAREVILTHLTPGAVDKEATLKYLHKYSKSKIVFAEDLMTVKLLSGEQQTPGKALRNNSRRSPLNFLDTDGDGRISRSEAKGPLARDFDRIDRNNDGYITSDELPAKKLRNRRQLRNRW